MPHFLPRREVSSGPLTPPQCSGRTLRSEWPSHVLQFYPPCSHRVYIVLHLFSGIPDSLLSAKTQEQGRFGCQKPEVFATSSSSSGNRAGAGCGDECRSARSTVASGAVLGAGSLFLTRVSELDAWRLTAERPGPLLQRRRYRRGPKAFSEKVLNPAGPEGSIQITRGRRHARAGRQPAAACSVPHRLLSQTPLG